MSIRRCCPCDTDGICPYEDMHSGYFGSCEYWCGAEEPQDDPECWEDDEPGAGADTCKWSEDGECILSCEGNKCSGNACERWECEYCEDYNRA